MTDLISLLAFLLVALFIAILVFSNKPVEVLSGCLLRIWLILLYVALPVLALVWLIQQLF